MPPTRTLRRLCQARDLIRDCYVQPLTLDEVAGEVDFSAWHFLRLFSATFQETPHQFLTRIRIEQAKRLLTIGNRSVTDICFDVGFTSLGSFSSLFRRHAGLSPAAFRRQVRSWITVPGHYPWVFVPHCFAAAFGGDSPLLHSNEK